MKCSLYERFFDFEFHDAVIYFKDCEGDCLNITAKYLNLHKDAKENPYGCDMEIASADICLRNFKICSFELLRAYQRDENGNMYTNEPQIIFKGEKASEKFAEELKSGVMLYDADIIKNDETVLWELTAGGRTNFIVRVKADDITAEWDEYSQKAWYELQSHCACDNVSQAPSQEEKT